VPKSNQRGSGISVLGRGVKNVNLMAYILVKRNVANLKSSNPLGENSGQSSPG